MNRLNKLLILIALSVAVALTGCREDIASVEIDFEEPTAGEIVSDAGDVHIHVHFHADNGDLHDIEVKLHPDGDVDDMIIDFEGHEHVPDFDFEQDVDLSGYPAGTQFHLEAKACLDHDCEDVEMDDIEFSIP